MCSQQKDGKKKKIANRPPPPRVLVAQFMGVLRILPYVNGTTSQHHQRIRQQ